MIDPNRSAPDKPGISNCCKAAGNLNWESVDGHGAYVGRCKTCQKKHYVIKASEAQM